MAESMAIYLGKQTAAPERRVGVVCAASVVGRKEGEGPLGARFDRVSEDSYFGKKSWESAESEMLRQCVALACEKGGWAPESLRWLLAGDLQSQCTGSAFALRDAGAPYLGLYGACSTMGEALGLGALLVDGGAERVCAATCSHFCSAERQFRTPLEYGSQRAPTAQWTATAAGAALLAPTGGRVRITHVTTGRIVDAGVTDAANMGAAMAPAALDTLAAHFADTGRSPDDYDAVITGDLGAVGHALLREIAAGEGLRFGRVFTDCGMLLYNVAEQDVHAGGSGCGCSASVFAAHILRCMEDGLWRRVLFAPTGALLSAVSTLQGESIPGICHAVALEAEVN